MLLESGELSGTKVPPIIWLSWDATKDDGVLEPQPAISAAATAIRTPEIFNVVIPHFEKI